MKKILLISSLFILSSCNVWSWLLNSSGDPDNDFYNNTCSTCGENYFDSLIDFWRFEENGGARASLTGYTTLTDTAATNNITVGGRTGVECDSGAAADYHLRNAGYSDTINTGDSLTISFWIYPNTLGGSVPIFEASGTFGLYYGGLSGGGNGDFRFIYDGTNIDYSDWISGVGQWYHIVITYDGSNAILRVDNSIVETIGQAPNTFAISNWGMCTTSGGTTSDFNIDSFGIWRRVLTDDEITRLYNGNNSLD